MIERSVSGQRSGISDAKVLDRLAPMPSAANASGRTQQDAAARTAPKLASAPTAVSPAPERRGVTGEPKGSSGMAFSFIGRLRRENPLCIL
jgi:hypothetical protein